MRWTVPCLWLLAACAGPTPRPQAPLINQGGRTTEQVMEVILRHKADLQSCADEARRFEPGVTGKLVLRFRIEADGSVSSTDVVSPETEDLHFTKCIRQYVMPRLRFVAASGPDDIIFPFKF